MEFLIATTRPQELVDITERVDAIVAQSGVDEGLCHVFVPHATAAVVINENHDPNLPLDLLDALNKSYPDHAGWRHDRIDNNGGAHLKAAVLGPSETIPIKQGRLLLGTWQAVMLVELDGPKERRVVVTVQ